VFKGNTKMRFLLSDLNRAQFPDPIATGRELFLPGGHHGLVSQCDGIFFNIGQAPCVNLLFWIMHNGELVQADQVEVAFEPKSTNRVELSDEAIKLFHLNKDLTHAGLQRAIVQAISPPSRLNPPRGCDEYQLYFKRHEPYCHELRQAQPDVMWRAYFRGGIPQNLSGFEADYNDMVLSKMISYHAHVNEQLMADLKARIQPPPDRYLWMADYARRKGIPDRNNVRDGAAAQVKLLSIPSTTGPISPRYESDVMTLLMANPERQTIALVLFALTDGVSTSWSKPLGFDRWLLSTCVVP